VWTIFLVLGVVFLGTGVWRLGGAVAAIVGWRAAQRWCETRGTIAHAAVRAVWERTSGQTLDWRSWWADVGYDYVVDGQSYRGQRVAFGYRGLSRAGAEDVVARFPTGASVPVWYDPARPERAVLMQEPAWTGLAYRTGGGVGLVLLGWVLVAAAR
jgi:hypothetical protein